MKRSFIAIPGKGVKILADARAEFEEKVSTGRWSKAQAVQLKRALAQGVPVSDWNPRRMNAEEMFNERLRFAGVDVSQDTKFDTRQIECIEDGIKKGVDVSWYADPKYKRDQMEVILEGLETGVDVSWYADPKFNGDQMAEIRLGLDEGLDVSIYANPKFNGDQMEEIRRGLESGFDVSIYANPKYDWAQMMKIRNSLEKGETPFLGQEPKESRTYKRPTFDEV